VGALALYLFTRYHIQNELWPPFYDREQWYKTRLLAKEGRPYQSLTYQAHSASLTTAFEAAKCLYLKGTHVGRKEGCKLADMMDVPDAQMRRLGRWDHSRMTQHYSTGLPRQGARMLAGHGPEPGIFTPLYNCSQNRKLLSRTRMSRAP
jgi:Centromere DNA-binding protein complex CBF3 subunit, domain 2